MRLPSVAPSAAVAGGAERCGRSQLSWRCIGTALTLLQKGFEGHRPEGVCAVAPRTENYELRLKIAKSCQPPPQLAELPDPWGSLHLHVLQAVGCDAQQCRPKSFTSAMNDEPV